LSIGNALMYEVRKRMRKKKGERQTILAAEGEVSKGLPCKEEGLFSLKKKKKKRKKQRSPPATVTKKNLNSRSVPGKKGGVARENQNFQERYMMGVQRSMINLRLKKPPFSSKGRPSQRGEGPTDFRGGSWWPKAGSPAMRRGGSLKKGCTVDIRKTMRGASGAYSTEQVLVITARDTF